MLLFFYDARDWHARTSIHQSVGYKRDYNLQVLVFYPEKSLVGKVPLFVFLVDRTVCPRLRGSRISLSTCRYRCVVSV